MRQPELLIKYLRFSGFKYKCILCGRSVRRFFPFSTNIQSMAKKHGFRFDFRKMETLNYDQCNCPFCLSSDRERFYAIFLDQYFSTRKRQHQILDFAPTASFSDYLRNLNFVQYTSTDLSRDDVDIKMDICNMQIKI